MTERSGSKFFLNTLTNIPGDHVLLAFVMLVLAALCAHVSMRDHNALVPDAWAPSSVKRAPAHQPHGVGQTSLAVSEQGPDPDQIGPTSRLVVVILRSSTCGHSCGHVLALLLFLVAVNLQRGREQMARAWFYLIMLVPAFRLYAGISASASQLSHGIDFDLRHQPYLLGVLVCVGVIHGLLPAPRLMKQVSIATVAIVDGTNSFVIYSQLGDPRILLHHWSMLVLTAPLAAGATVLARALGQRYWRRNRHRIEPSTASTRSAAVVRSRDAKRVHDATPTSVDSICAVCDEVLATKVLLPCRLGVCPQCFCNVMTVHLKQCPQCGDCISDSLTIRHCDLHEKEV